MFDSQSVGKRGPTPSGIDSEVWNHCCGQLPSRASEKHESAMVRLQSLAVSHGYIASWPRHSEANPNNALSGLNLRGRLNAGRLVEKRRVW